ncbi:type II secretion system F family protein [Gleimia hominis]|uniref:type II secretion system F family protein n=1 Tax=Gleimia hominis TaxID=595468 RepID=UPI000C800122|nr:type II secretion system F family protein [Gleimia hominis]WIK64742.1 type II secretion system F family protein [Gleimia hominis]
MNLLFGSGLGVGLVLIIAAVRRDPMPRPPQGQWRTRIRERFLDAQLGHRAQVLFWGVQLALPLVLLLLVYAFTRAWPVAVMLAIMVVALPWQWVKTRSNRRRRQLAAAWPDVADSLLSAILAGVSLPQAVIELEHHGPEVTRPLFEEFARIMRSTGRFSQALDTLETRVTNSQARRMIEGIRLARELGGSELGNLLRDLAVVMREDARVRGEIEARQSWTVNGARLAVAAPWIVLLLISLRTDAAAAYSTPTGMSILAAGGLLCVFAYAVMRRIASLEEDA